MRLLLSHKKILEYLSRYGSVNTFRLSKDLKIDRGKLIDLVKELANGGLTNFRSGTVARSDKLIEQKVAKSKEAEKEKPISKTCPLFKKPLKSKILKEKYSKLEKAKIKIQRSKDNWLKKEEELQTQRDSIAQKLEKETAILYQVRKEKKKTEKNLVEWEKSLSQREEDVQKREKSVSAARKRLKREKLKEKKIKPRAVAKKIKPVSKPKIEKPIVPRSSSTSKQILYPKPNAKPEVSGLLEQNSRKARTFEKIEVSKSENKQPEIIAREPWQPMAEISEEKFHNLIEQEISLLKQKRINEARNIHLQIKGMISEVTDTNQRKMIIKDWNRIKDIC